VVAVGPIQLYANTQPTIHGQNRPRLIFGDVWFYVLEQVVVGAAVEEGLFLLSEAVAVGAAVLDLLIDFLETQL
jgi:hypothetical protein